MPSTPSTVAGTSTCPAPRRRDSLLGRSLHLPSGRKLRLVSHLGQGAYGTVLLGLDQSSGQLFAVKHLKDHHLTPQQRQLQRQEARLHLRCSQHPNIVKLYEVVEAAQPGSGWFLVMEFCEQRDLFDYITGGDLANEADPVQAAKRIFKQLCSAVEHCHRQGVYHRDLKPENILLVKDPRTGQLECRVADFGLATDQRLTAERGCGSDFYMPPEARKSSDETLKTPYDPVKADVWALSVLLCNLACGRNPWNKASVSDRGFFHYVKNPKDGLKILLPITDELNRILSWGMHPDPAQRPAIRDLLHAVLKCRRFRRPGVRFGAVRAEPGVVVEESTDEEDEVLSFTSSNEDGNSCPTTPNFAERKLVGIHQMTELDLSTSPPASVKSTATKTTSTTSTMTTSTVQTRVRRLFGI